MSVQKIIRVLNLHSVPYFMKGDRVLADSMIGGTGIFENTIDVTDYTFKDLMYWLGYWWVDKGNQ